MSHRRTDHAQDHFDLLPFIAIMMCLLGSLLLVTLSVAAISIGPAAGEGWIPSRDASRPSKTPVLIEWDGSTAIVHRNGRTERLGWSAEHRRIKREGKWYTLGRRLPNGNRALTETSDRDDRPGIGALLADLSQQRETHYALFAVRPSGFDTFGIFSDEFRYRDIDVGYEPVRQEKRLRLLAEATR